MTIDKQLSYIVSDDGQWSVLPYVGDETWYPADGLPVVPTWPYDQSWTPTITTTGTITPSTIIDPPKTWVKGRIETIGSRHWSIVSMTNALIRIVVMKTSHAVKVTNTTEDETVVVEPGASLVVSGTVFVRARCGHSAPVRTARIRVDALA